MFANDTRMCASHEHLSKMALKLVEMLAMQAMNFLAALLLLLMPEEDAFWTLTSLIDGYFEGYYTEKMAEAQVGSLLLVTACFCSGFLHLFL